MREQRRPLLFFSLLIVAAVPIWLASDRLGVLSSLRIPTSDLVLAFLPLLVAFGLTVAREGFAPAVTLVASAFDVRTMRPRRWLFLVVLGPPGIYVSAFVLQRLAGSTTESPVLHPGSLALLSILFLLLAAGEEVGWSGYAFGPLQERWGALRAALIISVPWWLGHLPSMLEIGATGADIAWWALGSPGLRIIMAWLYARTNASLSAMVLFHALLNLSRIAIIPVEGSHYLTAYQATADLVIAVVAVMLIASTRGRL